MRLKRFIKFEIKNVLGRGYIAIVLVFCAASGYFLQFGISQYKHNLEEKNNFVEFERGKYKYYIYPSKHGNYGIRILYEPSYLMALFDSGPVPLCMTTFIDGSERMKIYQPLKGQSAFSSITSAFMTYAGFILLFGSVLVLLYGFVGSKNHEWLKFLQEVKMVGSRKRLFLYQLISRSIVLLLFCLVMALITLILFIINGVVVNIGWLLIFTSGIFVMLWCFLLGGMIAGTLKSRFWSWTSIGIAWFFLSFLIPVLVYHFTYSRATSIQSPYKMETVKLELFQKYESEGLEKGGKFDQSKRGIEQEKGMFLYFWNGGFRELMGLEKKMVDMMKSRIYFYQAASGIFPSSFFLSFSNEISSRGFANLIGFNEYSQEMKKAYIWYLAQNYIFSTIMKFPPFIEETENIYQGQIRLPDNYGFGMMVSFLWLLVLIGLYWFMFNRMLDRADETKRNLNPDELTKNKTNIIFTSDKGILPQLITKMRYQNIPFLSVPKPACLPGDTKVKNLFYFFGLAVPESLKEIADKYGYNLEPDQKGKVLSEITRSLKAGVIIFDNFLAGLSDEIIHNFAGVLKSLKKDCTIVYFTNSLMITTVICDPVNDHIHKWTEEQIAF